MYLAVQEIKQARIRLTCLSIIPSKENCVPVWECRLDVRKLTEGDLKRSPDGMTMAMTLSRPVLC